MSNQFGHSNKSTGRSGGINQHPGSDPKGTSSEPFSSMAKVDTSEHHVKSIKNMSAQPSHVKSMNIEKGHSYAKQSHAVKPENIESFVGGKNPSMEKTKVVKPKGPKGQY